MDTATLDRPLDATLEAQLFGHADETLTDTPTLIAAMLDSGKGISDLIFSPGRPPQVERHGELVTVPLAGLDLLHAGRYRARRARPDRPQPSGAECAE